MAIKKLPRILLAAPASGSGKTAVTCGLLRLLWRKGEQPRAFKCGPDYIDPIFHTHVLDTPCRNIDTFFAHESLARRLFEKSASQGTISVIEGVMGYYDGLGGTSLSASSWEAASVLETPVILVINARGMSRSVAALLRGFLSYQENSRIRGVILNQVSEMTASMMKAVIEKETDVKVVGYVPVCREACMESRHLGLRLPERAEELRRQIDALADVLEKTLDLEAILDLARQAGPLPETEGKQTDSEIASSKPKSRLRIGIARDEAFCFYYEDGLDLYRQMGAELVPFSPLRDGELPEGISGLLLGGGYPETAAAALADNASMRHAVRRAVESGMPCRAECGGFLYLHRNLQGEDGNDYPMAGVIPARAYRSGKQSRFGYITLEAAEDGRYLHRGELIRGHEFHHWDSEQCGASCTARKPVGQRVWPCMIQKGNLLAGFPHIYDPAAPFLAHRFVKLCREYGKKGERKMP